jgi:hypothetical protein
MSDRLRWNFLLGFLWLLTLATKLFAPFGLYGHKPIIYRQDSWLAIGGCFLVLGLVRVKHFSTWAAVLSILGFILISALPLMHGWEVVQVAFGAVLLGTSMWLGSGYRGQLAGS